MAAVLMQCPYAAAATNSACPVSGYIGPFVGRSVLNPSKEIVVNKDDAVAAYVLLPDVPRRTVVMDGQDIAN